MVVRSNQENVPLSTPSTRKEPRRLCRTRRKKGPSMSDWSRHRRLVAVRWRALFEVFELDLAIWGLGLVNCASVPWLCPPIKAKWATIWQQIFTKPVYNSPSTLSLNYLLLKSGPKCLHGGTLRDGWLLRRLCLNDQTRHGVDRGWKRAT